MLFADFSCSELFVEHAIAISRNYKLVSVSSEILKSVKFFLAYFLIFYIRIKVPGLTRKTARDSGLS